MYKYITVAYKTVKYINVYVYIYSRDKRRKRGDTSVVLRTDLLGD